MFNFKDVERSDEGVLSARCGLDRAYTFFEGHFESRPIMPAAAQLQMIDTLIRLDRRDEVRLIGGSSLKFVQKIYPGDTIDLLLRYRNHNMVDFSIQKEDASLASKGTLILTGDDVEN